MSEPNRASIYRSLTINISKEMMCYSDFPIPADYPNYMHHSKILKYFRMYAEHFKLLQHIHFQVTWFALNREQEEVHWIFPLFERYLQTILLYIPILDIGEEC